MCYSELNPNRKSRKFSRLWTMCGLQKWGPVGPRIKKLANIKGKHLIDQISDWPNLRGFIKGLCFVCFVCLNRYIQIDTKPFGQSEIRSIRVLWHIKRLDGSPGLELWEETYVLKDVSSNSSTVYSTNISSIQQKCTLCLFEKDRK